MNEFNERFQGILLAYLNDTCYTLDNSDCNELSKFVQGLIDERDALRARCAELELRLDAYNGNMMDVLQAENERLREAIEKSTNGVTYSYYTEDGYFECRYCSHGWMLEEDPFDEDFHMHYCPTCGHKITEIVSIPTGYDGYYDVTNDAETGDKV